MKERKKEMDLHGLSRSVWAMLKENGVRKTMRPTRHVLHVSDDDGNQTDFVLKRQDTAVLFQVEDIEIILKYCIQAMENALQSGESINARGFGKLEVKYREARRTKDIETGEWIDVAGRYVPKFTFGSDLRTAAKLYEISLTEGEIETRADRELSEEELEE